MINIKDIFGHDEYAWIVPVAFAAIIAFNLFTGIFKGWKSALYYGVWNIIALVVGVFATKPIIKLALGNVDTSSISIGLDGFLSNHPAVVPVVLIAWLLIIMPIAGLIKIPFRKKLKLNKPAKVSARLGGMAISGVFSIPLAVFTANAVTVVTGSTSFSQIIDPMVYGLTFGQDEGISKYVDEVRNYVSLVKDNNWDTFEDMFSGKTPDVNDTQKHDQIQSLLNGPSAPLILENAKGTLLEKLNAGTLPSVASIQAAALPDNQKFVVAPENWNKIADVLSSKYGWTNDIINALKTSFTK